MLNVADIKEIMTSTRVAQCHSKDCVNRKPLHECAFKVVDIGIDGQCMMYVTTAGTIRSNQLETDIDSCQADGTGDRADEKIK